MKAELLELNEKTEKMNPDNLDGFNEKTDVSEDGTFNDIIFNEKYLLRKKKFRN